MVICIDVDGTKFDNSDDYHIVGIKKGAKEFINKLYDSGHIIIIWSSRNSGIFGSGKEESMREVKYNLDLYGVKYDWIDDGNNGKIPADIYIDDKAIGFSNWDDELYNKILEFGIRYGEDTFDEQYIEFFKRARIKPDELNEATIKELLSRADSGNRSRAGDRSVRFEGFDEDYAWFVAKGGERDYGIIIQLVDFWDVLEDDKYKTYLDKARRILAGDVKVYCECPSFLYNGFAYIGTRDGYVLDEYPEHRKPVVRNPDLKGSVCKHLIVALRALSFYGSDLARHIKEIFG